MAEEGGRGRPENLPKCDVSTKKLKDFESSCRTALVHSVFRSTPQMLSVLQWVPAVHGL